MKMRTKINVKTSLKTLPLLAVLAVGMSLSPSISIAGKGDHGKHKEKYSHNSGHKSGKAHHRDNHRVNKQAYRSHGNSHRNNRGHGSKDHHGSRHGHYKHHAYNKHDNHGRGYVYNHAHGGHGHTSYIVNDYYYREPYYVLDPLRFMIGLHTDNLDIIFSD